MCNPAFGVSVGRGSYTFSTGKWTDLSQTITLNTPGQLNGKLLVVVDGKQAITFEKVNWRSAAAIGFTGIHVETFFGGGDSSWASPSDQYSYFKDFALEVN